MKPTLRVLAACLLVTALIAVLSPVYRDLITPRRVAEQLVLSDDMPGSMRSWGSGDYTHLLSVRNAQSGETERRAGELQASLHFGRIEDIFALGLHEYRVRVHGRIHDLGERVARDFLVSATD